MTSVNSCFSVSSWNDFTAVSSVSCILPLPHPAPVHVLYSLCMTGGCWHRCVMLTTTTCCRRHIDALAARTCLPAVSRLLFTFLPRWFDAAFSAPVAVCSFVYVQFVHRCYCAHRFAPVLQSFTNASVQWTAVGKIEELKYRHRRDS